MLLGEVAQDSFRVLGDETVRTVVEPGLNVRRQRLRAGVEDRPVRGRAAHDRRDDPQRAVVERYDAQRGQIAIAEDVAPGSELRELAAFVDVEGPGRAAAADAIDLEATPLDLAPGVAQPGAARFGGRMRHEP